MKLYLIGLALVFLGFLLGFFVAIVCTCAGRADEMEEEILNRIGKK